VGPRRAAGQGRKAAGRSLEDRRFRKAAGPTPEYRRLSVRRLEEGAGPRRVAGQGRKAVGRSLAAGSTPEYRRLSVDLVAALAAVAFDADEPIAHTL